MQLLRKILWPVSLLYGAGVYLRNWAYDLGIFSSTTYSTPTLSVGNLSLGGTGKTPMIEWLIRQLKDQKKIAVLSRGYKRDTSGFLIAASTSTAAEIGDEPLQILRKFPGITLAVDANRRRGIQQLEDQIKPDLILLDDAFQHRRVQPGFSILLTTYNCLYTDDWFLPTGTLRDSRNQAKRADLIIVTKCPPALSEVEMSDIKKKLKPKATQEVLFCTLQYADKVLGSFGERDLSELRTAVAALVTGIANPEPLLNYLHKAGIEVRHHRYADHHKFTKDEMALFEQEDFVLTTEKDFVRGLEALDHVGYIEVRHQFLGDGKEKLLGKLENLKR